MVKLAFATVLYQYFDISEFTCADAIAKDHDDRKRFLMAKSRQVQYMPELASRTSIRTAFGVGEVDRSSDDDLAPLLVNRTGDTSLEDGLVANRLRAGLVFVRTNPTTDQTVFSSLDAQQVSGLGLFVHTHTSR